MLGPRRKQSPPSPTGKSTVVLWLHQGNVQALQEGQALGLQRRSRKVQDWQSEEESPVIPATPGVELGNVRCCFLAGQESPASTWALETVWANSVMNEERHSWRKMEDLVFLISGILAYHCVSDVPNQAVCDTRINCNMSLWAGVFKRVDSHPQHPLLTTKLTQSPLFSVSLLNLPHISCRAVEFDLLKSIRIIPLGYIFAGILGQSVIP